MSRCGLNLEPNSRAVKTVYALCDEAIDQDASDVEEYGETGDLRHLVFRSGYTPVEFRISPVSWTEYLRIITDARGDWGDSVRELFRIGVRGWSGWEYPDGTPFVPVFQARPGRIQRLSDEVFVDIPDLVVKDIGKAIYNISGLDQRLSEFAEKVKSRSPPKDEHRKNS